MLLADHSKQVNNIYSAYATGILADALYAEGKYKNAADSYKQAFEAYKRHYRSDTGKSNIIIIIIIIIIIMNIGPETVELMGALQLISWVLLTKRDYDEALIACQNALGLTEKLLGPKDLDVASSMVNLATAYVNKGDLGSEPEILLNKALNIYNQKGDEIIDKAQFTEEMKNIHFLTGMIFYYSLNLMKSYRYHSQDQSKCLLGLYFTCEATMTQLYNTTAKLLKCSTTVSIITLRLCKH